MTLSLLSLFHPTLFYLLFPMQLDCIFPHIHTPFFYSPNTLSPSLPISACLSLFSPLLHLCDALNQLQVSPGPRSWIAQPSSHASLPARRFPHTHHSLLLSVLPQGQGSGGGGGQQGGEWASGEFPLCSESSAQGKEFL